MVRPVQSISLERVSLFPCGRIRVKPLSSAYDSAIVLGPVHAFMSSMVMDGISLVVG